MCITGMEGWGDWKDRRIAGGEKEEERTFRRVRDL